MLTKIDQKAIDALLRGQGCANYLKTLIEGGSVPMEPLVDIIIDSFSLAISFMDSSVPVPESSQNRAVTMPRVSLKKKRPGEEEGLDHYRDDCPDPLVNDGFSWRKYGQKTIKTSTHQRSYYRCAYARERKCNALKRVQQIQENPSVYRTTYVGQHTCEAPVFSHPANDDATDNSKMIRFDKFDQEATYEPVLPQLVSVENQEKIEDEEKGTGHVMNQEFDISELLVDDGQLWAADLFPPFSPRDFMFLDNFSPFQV